MASVQTSAVENSVRPSRDCAPDTQADSSRQREPSRVLFVAKRASVRALAEEYPQSARTDHNRSDTVLEACLGPHREICLEVVTSQRAALQVVKTNPPQAVLVEIDNRPQSRVRFCRMLRSRVPAMGVIAVGEREPESSFAYDGFLTFPLDERALASVLSNLDTDSVNHVLQCGAFELNLATRTVKTPRGPRHLTPKLCALLELLMLRHDEVVGRSEIMEYIWQTTYLEDTRTLDVHVRWLREAIEPDPSNPRYLVTERGTGYILHSS